MTYRTRPVDVDARQYTGGEENGKALETWVNSLGGNAMWSPGNVFEDLTIPEEFSLGKSRFHMEWNIPIGSWLVYKENFITIYYDDMFHKKFEQI